MEALGLEDFDQYYQYLLFDPAREDEMDRILELVTTNETYFFRETNQLNAFTEEILPELRKRNSELGMIRIWSAGCSSAHSPKLRSRSPRVMTRSDSPPRAKRASRSSWPRFVNDYSGSTVR